MVRSRSQRNVQDDERDMRQIARAEKKSKTLKKVARIREKRKKKAKRQAERRREKKRRRFIVFHGQFEAERRIQRHRDEMYAEEHGNNQNEAEESKVSGGIAPRIQLTRYLNSWNTLADQEMSDHSSDILSDDDSFVCRLY